MIMDEGILVELKLFKGMVVDDRDPQKLGRVKVLIPGVYDDTPVWAPVVMPGSPKSRGLWALPKPNDVVLCAFLVGDIHEPIVLGTFPESQNESNYFRILSSGDAARSVILQNDEWVLGLGDKRNKNFKELTISTNQFEITSKGTDGADAFTFPGLFALRVSAERYTTHIYTLASILMQGEATISLDAPNITIRDRVVRLTKRPI